MYMNMKRVSKFGLCLVSALALNVFAQDNWAGKDLNVSFSNKRIDNFNFKNAKAVAHTTDFRRATGENPDFTGANLNEVSFQNAVISNASFENASLVKATISGADIRGSSFEGANMQEANLYRATLLDSQFPKANLKNARLDAMKVSDPHQRELLAFPDGKQRPPQDDPREDGLHRL